jgi:hypothetical protein
MLLDNARPLERAVAKKRTDLGELSAAVPRPHFSTVSQAAIGVSACRRHLPEMHATSCGTVGEARVSIGAQGWFHRE